MKKKKKKTGTTHIRKRIKMIYLEKKKKTIIILGHSVDVRLIPLPMEHCSDKPCVWYGLNSVNYKFINN